MADTDKLRAHMARLKELRDLKAQIADMAKANSEVLDQTESEIMAMLEEAQLANFRCDIGLISVQHRTSVKTPKTPEDKMKLFDYLKSKGLYESMVSVNSMTLNSFYKDAFAAAKEAGDDDFQIPGINEVTIEPILSFRRA